MADRVFLLTIGPAIQSTAPLRYSTLKLSSSLPELSFHLSLTCVEPRAVTVRPDGAAGAPSMLTSASLLGEDTPFVECLANTWKR